MFVNVPIGVAVWAVGRLVLVETARRHGRFDFAGAVTSTLGMTAIVLGLVEAGSAGWADPLTVASLLIGVALLGAFVRNETGAEEPILPLRLLAHSARSAANLARGLVYAGMYGMFFFLSQFLQDLQGYSALRAGISFLPIPISVFAFSQLTSRSLVNRIPAKVVMVSGISLSALSLALASRLHAGASYAQILVCLVMVGAGTGISLVALTSASLAGVEPADAGAASGLINVVQQIGAALGLAVLVNVFGSVTHHAPLANLANSTTTDAARALAVRGLDDAFAAGAVFALVALAMVAFLVRPIRHTGALSRVELELELDA
jgi:predicted MFS family arabinose efflux permease